MNEKTQNYRITLQYEGTRYDGWQKQGNTDNTIQGRLEAVLTRMCGEPIEVHGSGRTDAGVHAVGQVANFHLPCTKSLSQGKTGEDEYRKTGGALTEPTPDHIMEYLNRYLPEDIAVTDCSYVPDRFHSRLNAVKKTYVYRIEMGPKRDVFVRRCQYGLGEQLDVEAMRKAAELLCGTHDYKSFCGNKKMKKSTVRTIYSIQINQENFGKINQDDFFGRERRAGESLLTLRFTGNGFLQNMIRILTGTLIEVGQGKRPWQSMTDILQAEDRQAAGFTAPAEGLCLEQVYYEEQAVQAAKRRNTGCTGSGK